MIRINSRKERKIIENIFKIGYMACEKYNDIDEDKAFQKWQREEKIDIHKIDIPQERIKRAFVSGYRISSGGIPYGLGFEHFIRPYAFEFLHEAWVTYSEEWHLVAKYLMTTGYERILWDCWDTGWIYGYAHVLRWSNATSDVEMDIYIRRKMQEIDNEDIQQIGDKVEYVLKRFYREALHKGGGVYANSRAGTDKALKRALFENYIGMCLYAGRVEFVEDDISGIRETMASEDVGEYQQCYRNFVKDKEQQI